MKALTKIILITIIGAAASLIVYLLLVSPSLARVADSSQNLIAKRAESVTLDQQIRAYKTAQSDLSKATEKQRIASLIPKREDLVESVLSLERAMAATNSEHSLKIIEDKDAVGGKAAPAQILTEKPGLKEINYRLSTISDFAGTVNLLKFLEHLPQFTEIYKLNFSAETRDAGGSVVRTGRIIGSLDGIFVIKDEKTK